MAIRSSSIRRCSLLSPRPQQQAQQMGGGDFRWGMGAQQIMRQPSNASSTNITPDYLHPNAPPLPPHPYDAHGDSFAAKRVRKLVHCRVVDYTSTVVQYMQIRMWQRDVRDRTTLQPTPAAAIDMLPTAAYVDNPSTSFAAKFVHASMNKNCFSINRVLWTPTGRRLITGYGEQSPALAGRSTGTFPLPEAPTTPGPFAAGLTRNERTIPGIGVAMPLSLPSFDAADQGEQRLPVPGMMPVAAPPLPPGLHASVLAASGQQAYQQIPQQFPPPQQQSALPQQMGSLLLAPPNLVQLQPPGHLPLLPHPHLPRPPPPIGMPSSMPQMQPSQMGIQGSANQMIPPLPQSHLMGMNPMHSGPLPTSSISPPVESFINGIANTQGSSTGAQTFPYGGMFNRTQSGQLGSVPGLGTYQ